MYTINNTAYNFGYIIEEGVIKKSDWVTEKETLSNGHKNYYFSIPIIMDGKNAGNTGTVEIEMEAFEYTDDKKSATQTCTINYDMQKPELTLTGYWDGKSDDYIAKITQLTEDGDDFISLKGTVSESGTQSGFASVAMQVTRTLDGNTYVIDSMISKGSGNDNRHQVSGSGAESGWTQIAGLWCHKMSGVTVNDAMLTLPSAPNDSHIRLNSLCFINGMPYLITEVNNSTMVLTLSETPSVTGTTDVYFAMAQIIDNEKSEDPVSLPTVFNYGGVDNWGDGDQMKESVKDNIGICSWTALINSWNIFDGSTDFIFTAFDKADNWTTVTKHAKIANNEPRIAGVKFGCDDNGDDSISDSEMKTAFSGWYNKDSANKKTGVTENGKNEKQEIVTSFSCPADIADGGYVFVVKDDITIVPEVVGGNGNLSWSLYHQKTLGGSKTLIAEGDTTSSGNNIDVRTFSVTIDKAVLTEKIASDFTDEYLLLEIYDATPGSPNVSSIIIKTATLLHDKTAPSMQIDPFYWNDKTDNSVYKDASGN
ncbi:MAG: hypothetical protein IKP67_08460, partial [Spirochaetales bacterium]|nr:hypothetical protein [Spirochaetales bacterium]